MRRRSFPPDARPGACEDLHDPNSRPCGPLSPSAARILALPPVESANPSPTLSPSCHTHCASAAQAPSVQDILENFEFRNQIPRLSRADALGSLIEKLTSPDVNLSPDPVLRTNGTVRHPGLDNHGMGTVFEALIRRFNEENNEEAGEHFTPRDAVKLMANLVFLPVADQIESGTYLLYDGACGTGGMLTVAEDVLQQIAKERGKQVSTHLFGQEINAETYAICKADLLLKGEGEAADNIVGGPEHSTLSNDAFPSREFDFMLSNPPYGKSWKTDLQRMGDKKDMRDPRFVIEHADDPEYSLVTRSSDGQMLFLASGSPEARISAGDHVSLTRTARSATLAVEEPSDSVVSR